MLLAEVRQYISIVKESPSTSKGKVNLLIILNNGKSYWS